MYIKKQRLLTPGPTPLLAEATRAVVTALGLKLFSPQSRAASATAVRAPKGTGAAAAQNVYAEVALAQEIVTA
jgi:aspartate aminotransferase-like enzyme